MLFLMTLLATQPRAAHHEPIPARAAHKVAQPKPAGEACGNPAEYQILLDKRGFSPGEIDGAVGPNLQHAIAAFQTANHLTSSGHPDCDTWKALTREDSEAWTDYQLTDEDVRGPFLDRPLPEKLDDQAGLSSLEYGSVAEAIGERFHVSPQLLSRMNRGRQFTAGTTFRVPSVTPFVASRKPQPDASATNVTIQVSRHESTLRAVGADGSLIFLAPVSSGSEHDPLPIGTWKVTGTSWMPQFNYNPDLFWDAQPGDGKAVIKPGPNNPVGVVWVDINVPHYGLHGTPTPGLVGHAQSHGCVRLTNWDAARLASLVRPGTRVEFTE